MRKPEEFKNNILKLHSNLSLQGTNNTVFQMATLAPVYDKKGEFPEKMKKSLGIPIEVKNWFDIKSKFGVYERLYQLLIISLCSDIEFMFKDLLNSLIKNKTFSFGFYQRFTEVIKELESINYNFDEIQTELKEIEKGFQIRHISIHNMGYVDESFKNKVNTSYKINDKFFVNEEIYKSVFNSYWKLLEKIDDQTIVE